MTAADTAPPPTAKASVWEDFIDIYYAPSQVFERRRDGRFGLALLVITIVLSLLFWLSQTYLEPMYTAEMNRQIAAAMRDNPQMTQEMADQMRGFQRFGVIFSIIVIPIVAMLTGFVLWLVGKLFDSTQTLGQALMVGTYAQFPRVFDWIVRNVQGAVLSPEAIEPKYGVSLSLARFLDREAVSPVMYELAGRLDLFTLWVTALLAIGLHVTGAVPKARAYIAAGIVWLIGALPMVLGALREG
ncbi:MAG TPA: YIP1 family protein [Gemmatimonadaceae bacterium]